jgi:hypothetical protein
VESRSSLGRRLQSSFDPSIGEAFTGSEGGRANKGTEEADSDTRRIDAKTHMIGDAVTPKDRLRCITPECWQWKLVACIIALAIILALTLEARASDMPPFKLDHPICPGGFTIAQRYDERNAAGTIIKSVWVRKCTKGKIIYWGKV